MNEVHQLASALLTVVLPPRCLWWGICISKKGRREFRPSTMPLRHSCYGRTPCKTSLVYEAEISTLLLTSK